MPVDTLNAENNFIGGLKTEFTGLNYPPNSCTQAENVVFTLIGDVIRRAGFDLEANFQQLVAGTFPTNPVEVAINTYKWNNAGGDGQTQIVVVQFGRHVAFYKSSASTLAAPLSAQFLPSSVLDLTPFVPSGSTAGNLIDATEAQFADGNGFLFIFHPYIDPIYVQFDPITNAFSFNKIIVQIRDQFGVTPEPGNPAVSFRPSTLTNEHSYNLQNQGWTNLNPWQANSTTSNLNSTSSAVTLPLGALTFTIPTGLTGPAAAQTININWSAGVNYTATGDGAYTGYASGIATATVTSYTSGSGALVVNVVSSTTWNIGPGGSINSISNQNFTIASSNLLSTVTTFKTALGQYPSNADIWWEFKDTTGAFNPGTTAVQVPLSTAQAPQGHFLLNAFIQDRTAVSGVSGITVLSTFNRPSTGTWFQGRVWFTGVTASQNASGDMPYYTWTENIYFSQIVQGSDTTMFGSCFQAEDPTDNRLFQIQPDDGGVIVIQGSGTIYKLFPIQNGMLVFAANGIWVIRGNTGLGFTATDFSINKVSAVKSISSTSFVDVLGYPFFWNNEGIYSVTPTQQQAPYGFGGFNVDPLTVGTILSFYNNIPVTSKRFARGAYDPISYVLQWVYRIEPESADAHDRYFFDGSLSLNLHNRAFYPYTVNPIVGNTIANISGINYVDYPSGSLTPTFKYLTYFITGGNVFLSFAEERDSTNWVDWHSVNGTGLNYTSSFSTAYRLDGQGFRKFMPIYIDIFSRNNAFPLSSYQVQTAWDFTSAQNTRAQPLQTITIPLGINLSSGISYPNFGAVAPGGSASIFATRNIINRKTSMDYYASPKGGGSTSGSFAFVRNRIKPRGHGFAMQLSFFNNGNQPFDIVGWSIPEQVSVGN